MYGFRCNQAKIALYGPDAHLFEHSGDWTQSTATLTLRLAYGMLMPNTRT
jgi:hypothetical protein